MPMRRSTREFQFINTSHPDERAFLLKKLDKIKELPDNSCDIESDSIIKRYQRRPKQKMFAYLILLHCLTASRILKIMISVI